MYRTFLSWRFLRRRRTNLIGVFGIFLGVGALILILSIMTGFLEQQRDSVRGSLSDIVITLPPVEGTDRPRVAQPILDRLRADPRVDAATAHLGWLCILALDSERSKQLLSNSQLGQYAGVKLTGIDPDEEAKATEFRESLTRASDHGAPRVLDPSHPFAPPPGRDGSTGRPRASVIVGEQMYLANGLYQGASISLLTAVPDENSANGWAPKKREFVVAGTFRSKENEMDLSRIYVERGQLARFLAGVNEDDPLPETALEYSEVLVKLKDYERDGVAVVADFKRELLASNLIDEEGEIRTWEEYRGTILGAIENERTLMGIMLALILLVASFTIFAILSMMVTEKRRDVGILSALGATPRGIQQLFLMIAFWDALVGGVLGAVIGTWGALEIDGIERWLSRTFGVQIFNRDVYLFDHIPSVVQPLWVATIVLGAFLCALLFAALPAWRAARLDPLEALRYE